MMKKIQYEIDAKRRSHCGTVSIRDGEPWQLNPKEKDHDNGKPEIGRGSKKIEERHHVFVSLFVYPGKGAQLISRNPTQ
jgi:hypothetical protein